MSARIFLLVCCALFLSACGHLAAMAPPTMTPQEQQGRKVFESFCSRCHETTGEIVIVGPSLAGVATRAGGRIPGMDAAAYIRNSIEVPTAYTVEGFPYGVMPSTLVDELTPEQLDAVVAYLLTLQ